MTFERRFEDSAVAASYYPNAEKKIAYKEGVFLGYRHFDKTGRKPLFPFGHGLSYTRFKYSALTIAPEAMIGDLPVTVSFDVTNIGKRRARKSRSSTSGSSRPRAATAEGAEGFARIELAPGETKRVQLFSTGARCRISTWRPRAGGQSRGRSDPVVGSSSQRIELSGKLRPPDR